MSALCSYAFGLSMWFACKALMKHKFDTTAVVVCYSHELAHVKSSTYSRSMLACVVLQCKMKQWHCPGSSLMVAAWFVRGSAEGLCLCQGLLIGKVTAFLDW